MEFYLKASWKHYFIAHFMLMQWLFIKEVLYQFPSLVEKQIFILTYTHLYNFFSLFIYLYHGFPSIFEATVPKQPDFVKC